MSKPSSRFFNVFSIVPSVLVAMAIGAFLSSCKPAGDGADSGSAADAAERIKPFGQVAVEGQDNVEAAAVPAATPEAPVAASPAPAAVVAGTATAPAASAPAAIDGASTYKSACSVCHGAGIAGAPKFGDKAAWAPRIAQGEATLHQHSIEGYKGAAGVMPAKGGRMDLSDNAVIAAVDYMVAAAR